MRKKTFSMSAIHSVHSKSKQRHIDWLVCVYEQNHKLYLILDLTCFWTYFPLLAFCGRLHAKKESFVTIIQNAVQHADKVTSSCLHNVKSFVDLLPQSLSSPRRAPLTFV